jgi:hypothetical protein
MHASKQTTCNRKKALNPSKPCILYVVIKTQYPIISPKREETNHYLRHVRKEKSSVTKILAIVLVGIFAFIGFFIPSSEYEVRDLGYLTYAKMDWNNYHWILRFSTEVVLFSGVESEYHLVGTPSVGKRYKLYQSINLYGIPMATFTIYPIN